MSDILIKGMEMPKEGSAFAIAIHPDGTITSWTGREMPQYEAVPIPPHGRLIDADAICADIDEKRPGWMPLPKPPKEET